MSPKDDTKLHALRERIFAFLKHNEFDELYSFADETLKEKVSRDRFLEFFQHAISSGYVPVTLEEATNVIVVPNFHYFWIGFLFFQMSASEPQKIEAIVLAVPECIRSIPDGFFAECAHFHKADG